MSIQVYTIEFKLDVPEENHEAMLQISKQFARDLLSAATLISPDKPPMVIMRTEDSFYDHKEIELLEPSDFEMFGGSGS